MGASQSTKKSGPVRLQFQPYEDTWAEFRATHQKSYESKEVEDQRKQIFLDNVKIIEAHNSKYADKKSSYYMDINHFSDWTKEEFMQYHRYQMPEEDDTSELNLGTVVISANVKIPSEVDWRKKGYVTEVKHQGNCGSCWAFSTTGSTEGQCKRKTGRLTSLSEQQLVDCSGRFGNKGCLNGTMVNSYKYIQSVGGLESEADYPYQGKESGQCFFDESKIVPGTKVVGYREVERDNEVSLTDAVCSIGPISAAVKAPPSLQHYKGGIFDDIDVSVTLNHAVLVVGYNPEKWIIKNSWGTSWGDHGYYYIPRFKNNHSGIASRASYPVVASPGDTMH